MRHKVRCVSHAPSSETQNLLRLAWTPESTVFDIQARPSIRRGHSAKSEAGGRYQAGYPRNWYWNTSGSLRSRAGRALGCVDGSVRRRRFRACYSNVTMSSCKCYVTAGIKGIATAPDVHSGRIRQPCVPPGYRETRQDACRRRIRRPHGCVSLSPQSETQSCLRLMRETQSPLCLTYALI